MNFLFKLMKIHRPFLVCVRSVKSRSAFKKLYGAPLLWNLIEKFFVRNFVFMLGGEWSEVVEMENYNSWRKVFHHKHETGRYEYYC